jgi:TorA maturation chaperone TorD
MIMAGLPITSELLWTAKEMFQYPDQENLAELKAGLDQLLDWARLYGQIPEEGRSSAAASEDLYLDQLRIDHTALFINGFPVTKAHPFAGWYEGDGIIMGNSDSKMRQFYSRCGVECDQREIQADHIMVELEFMALMADRYEETGDDFFHLAMGEMLRHHMEYWISRFLKNIQDNARTDFSRSLADVLMVLFAVLSVQLKEVA